MKILVIRLSSLGDVLLSTAVLLGLKAFDPRGTIDVCTRPAYSEIFAAHPHVHAVIPYDDAMPSSTYLALRSGEIYDCVIDLHNNFRTRRLRRGMPCRQLAVRKHTIAKWLLVHTKIDRFRNVPDVIGRYVAALAPLDIRDNGALPEFVPLPTSLPDALAHFLKGVTVIGVAPGAKHFTKRWPAARFAAMCRAMIERHGTRVVLFGGEMDDAICNEIARTLERDGCADHVFNACSQLTLSQIAVAMDACASVVTNDSGLMHVAAARQRPIVAVFGSTVRQFGFVPRVKTIVEEVPGLSCRPCSHIGRASCPKGHFKCMMEIDVEQVVRDTVASMRA